LVERIKTGKLADRTTDIYRASRAQYERLSQTRYFWPGVYGLFLLLVFAWAWTFLHARLGAHFSQDSYGYFLLGKNVFEGLGYTTFSARDLSVDPSWPVVSKSFPPLHPILIGFVHFITDLGMRSASLVSLLFLAGTLVALFFFTRELDKASWLIPFFAFVVFFGTNQFYREEMEAGRSIPGMMLFFFLVVIFFLKSLDRGERKIKYEILSGALLAAMLHQRFDQTLFCLAFLFFSFFIYKLRGFSTKESLFKTSTILGTFVLFSLPWAIRNIVQFGAPFASDNTGSVKTTFTGLFCNSFWLPGQEPPTIFTHPEKWMNQRLGFLERNFDKIKTLSAPLIYFTPVAVLVMWKTLSFKQRVFAFLTLVTFFTTLTTISLTPYGDNRYFSLVHLNLCIVFGICVSHVFKLNTTEALRRFTHVALILVLLYKTLSGPNGSHIRKDFLTGNLIPNDQKAMIHNYNLFSQSLSPYLKKEDILSIRPHAERYTYFTGRRTVYVPSSLGRNQRAFYAFVKKWGVDYFFVFKKGVKQLRLQKYVVATIRGRKLVDCNAFMRDKKPIFERKGAIPRPRPRPRPHPKPRARKGRRPWKK
jgi:hypothetical protein